MTNHNLPAQSTPFIGRMSDSLEIYALGGLTIKVGGAPLTGLASRKAEALLVYLACTGRPQAREALAELLWEERTQSQSLANLRPVLTSLRECLGPYLLITRQTAAIHPESDWWLDAAELERQIAAAREQWTRDGQLPASAVAPLERALTLYRGDFLEGFYVRESRGFEEWLLLERERLRRRVAEALYHLVASHLNSGAYSAGIAQATRLLQMDPLFEEAHRQMMSLLARSGQRSAALNQYETCRCVLDEELGVAPAAETTALYEALQTGVLASTPANIKPIAIKPPEPPMNLPPQPTPFIGRSEELSQIADYLADPACRLLTIVGVGGIGKTRLAVQAAAAQLDPFADGVYFVGLAPLNSPDALALTIGGALNFTFYGQDDPKLQLFNYLREKALLLVIDNFEHLLEGVGLLADLLANAPRVKILATSRERLNLQEEWILPIEGLAVPVSEQSSGLEGYSAIQLFVQSAKRVQPHFALADHQAAVIAVCQRVEGMPLAIELAATWLRAMPCDQIAGQIERSLDFLATPLRNVPERQRSLRAVFDHSWKLLSDTERAVLPKLSVFRGGFDLEAAEQVAGASLSILASLVDKSLLRVNPSGRYDLHELLRQYAADKLTESGAVETIVHRHFEFFLYLAEQAEAHLYGPEEVAWLDRLEVEYDNLQAALAWSLNSAEAELGVRLAGALGWFWHLRTRLLNDGRRWLEKALAVAHDAPPTARIKVLNQAADIIYVQGDAERARMFAEEGLILAQQIGDTWSTAWMLSSLGHILLRHFHLDEGEAMLEQSLTLFRQIADKWGVHHALSRLILGLGHDQYERSSRILEEKLILARQAEARSAIGWALGGIGQMLQDGGGDPRQIIVACEESLAILREVSDNFGVAKVLITLGRAAQALGNYERAWKCYQECLILSREMRTRPLTVDCLLALSGLSRGQGRPQEATRLLAAADALSKAIGLADVYRIESNGDVAAVRAQLGEPGFAAAWAEGQALTLDQAVAYALEITDET